MNNSQNISEYSIPRQNVNPTKYCPNCGSLIETGQKFCPNCGAKISQSSGLVCPKCGVPLRENQKFCDQCGERVINHQAALLKTRGKKKSNRIGIVILIIGWVILLIAAAVFCIARFLPNVDKLISEGNYIKAYDVASDTKKADIMRENAVAVVSAMSVKGLKDRSSFKLYEAWVSDDLSEIVLNIAGNNAYGATVNNYWYYTFDEDEKTYSLINVYTDLEEEEEYSWDDAAEKLEKLINNLFLESVIELMSHGNELSKESVKNINNLYAQDLLDEIKLIDDILP